MRRSNRGFSLIELLVVIAIIAILAAIIFPVYARAKIAAYRGSDISNLNTLRNALQLYRVDQGAYPPALLGYATLYAGTGSGTVPADQLRSFLYTRRVDSSETFRPALDRVKPDVITTVFWPSADPRPVGSTPIIDTDGNGLVNNLDDTLGTRQAYSGTTVMRSWGGHFDPNQDVDGVGSVGTPFPAYFYNISGYDMAKVPNGPGGAVRAELRYTLFWTNYAIGTGAGFGAGSLSDDPRQLGYSDPPENTVITWDTYFRDYNNGLQRNKNDIVLFLGGAARPYDSVDLSDRAYRVMP